MITGWEIYWITRLDAIHGYLAGLCVLFCVFLFVALLGLIPVMVEELMRPSKYCKMVVAPTVAVILICGLVGAFIPTTNQAVAIYMIPKIANNEQVQKLPDNAAKFLNTKLEAWINETLKEKEKK